MSDTDTPDTTDTRSRLFGKRIEYVSNGNNKIDNASISSLENGKVTFTDDKDHGEQASITLKISEAKCIFAKLICQSNDDVKIREEIVRLYDDDEDAFLSSIEAVLARQENHGILREVHHKLLGEIFDCGNGKKAKVNQQGFGLLADIDGASIRRILPLNDRVPCWTSYAAGKCAKVIARMLTKGFEAGLMLLLECHSMAEVFDTR